MTTDTECKYCVSEADYRVKKIAHANRLARFAQAELNHTRDCLRAGMPTDVVLDGIDETLRLLTKLLAHCTN
jgi:hypothetical protein